MQKTVVVANAFGPLEYENFRDMRGVAHIEAYRRLRTFPLGESRHLVEEIRAIFGHNYDTMVLAVFLNDMQKLGMLQCQLQFSEKGRITSMHITVLDLDALAPHLGEVKQSMPPGDALNYLLNNYDLLYRKYTQHQWPRTAKEVSLARRVMTKCNGDPYEATKLARVFFTAPPETAPDDLGFVSFYYSVDKILATMVTEKGWETARIVGARNAAARRHEPTPEETAEFHAEAARYRAETKERKDAEAARAARLAEDDAL
jgi:hypothetical protein